MENSPRGKKEKEKKFFLSIFAPSFSPIFRTINSISVQFMTFRRIMEKCGRNRAYICTRLAFIEQLSYMNMYERSWARAKADKSIYVKRRTFQQMREQMKEKAASFFSVSEIRTKNVTREKINFIDKISNPTHHTHVACVCWIRWQAMFGCKFPPTFLFQSDWKARICHSIGYITRE